MNFYPNNIPNDFINRLDQPIQLPDTKYEIALCELSYISGFEVDEHESSFECFDFLAKYESPEENYEDPPKTEFYGKLSKVNLGKLSISNAEELVSILNEQVWKKVKRLKSLKRQIFSYDINQNRIWLNFEDTDYISIKLHSNILKLVGCVLNPTPMEVVYLGKGKRPFGYQYKGVLRKFGKAYRNVTWKSTCTSRDFFKYKPSINNVDTLLVYSNIIHPSQIGSGRANLLRFVDIPEEKKKNSSNSRITLKLGGNFFYMPLSLREISDIQIQIRDNNNLPVKFTDYVRISLHIRRQINNNNN